MNKEEFLVELSRDNSIKERFNISDNDILSNIYSSTYTLITVYQDDKVLNILPLMKVLNDNNINNTDFFTALNDISYINQNTDLFNLILNYNIIASLNNMNFTEINDLSYGFIIKKNLLNNTYNISKVKLNSNQFVNSDVTSVFKWLIAGGTAIVLGYFARDTIKDIGSKVIYKNGITALAETIGKTSVDTTKSVCGILPAVIKVILKKRL